MKVVVLSVGRVRQGFVKDGEREYLRRLTGSFAVELVELGLEAPESLSAAELMAREAVQIEKRTQGYDYIVALDERGRTHTSKEFAAFIDTRLCSGIRSLCFVIGGSFGLADRVRQESDYILSLSNLTLPHQLTRLVLVEQLYRAHTLLRGIAYHK
jgi:23S rRNA (pseudouridine1915-N3)-methyltransferase